MSFNWNGQRFGIADDADAAALRSASLSAPPGNTHMPPMNANDA
jgi:hypothetical protein